MSCFPPCYEIVYMFNELCSRKMGYRVVGMMRLCLEDNGSKHIIREVFAVPVISTGELF